MSGPMSQSPHYRMSPRRQEDFRRFPWDDPDFDRGFVDQGRMPFDGKRHPREDTEQQRGSYRQDTNQGGQRRPPLSPDPHRPGNLHHPPPEKFYRRTPPPHPRELGYNERRAISPEQAPHRHNVEGARGRGEFREEFPSFENRERPAHSPQRPPREIVPSLPPPHSSHQQRDPSAGWRRDDQARGLKRPRDGSPRPISHNLGRGEGRERGRGDTQAPYRERQREDLHHERSPYLDSQRRQIDDALHPGYRKEEAFRERHRSLERPTDGFGGGPGEHRGPQGGFPHRASRASGTLIVEHDHGNMDSRGPPQWEKLDDMRSRGPDCEREIHPRQMGPSQERVRKSNSRSDTREETRGRPVLDTRRDFGREPRRSPIRQDGTSPMNFPGRGGPLNHRGKGSPGPAKGRRNPGQGGRMEMGPSGSHPRSQQFPQGRQGPPQKQPGFQPREENWDVELREGEPRWAGKKPVLPQREGHRPGMMGQRPPRDGMGPGMSHHRERWSHQQNTSEMKVVTEETLSIKVDMKRPTNQNSSKLCYSTDRQLSLDLVNVGRQRLDFLPMLEHSGTYRESTTHTGTFAQEIIQLVHQVKEYYFRGDGISLNERFAEPQGGGSLEEDEDDEEEEEDEEDEQVEEKEVVEERPSLNRRFNMNMNALPDHEPLFSRLGRMESPGQDLLRDPGDLRHDLERRRQERLEGVKVTIPGGSLSQHPLGRGSEEYDDDDMTPGEQGGPEQGRRWTGGTGPRRGGPFRQNPGPPQRNNRPPRGNRPPNPPGNRPPNHPGNRPPNHPGNRMGPMRRQNNHNNIVGDNW